MTDEQNITQKVKDYSENCPHYWECWQQNQNTKEMLNDCLICEKEQKYLYKER